MKSRPTERLLRWPRSQVESAAQKLLLATLKEEKTADEKLTALAQGSIVEEAMAQ